MHSLDKVGRYKKHHSSTTPENAGVAARRQLALSGLNISTPVSIGGKALNPFDLAIGSPEECVGREAKVTGG